jgi:hypothetical protein
MEKTGLMPLLLISEQTTVLHMQQIVQQELLLQQTMTQTYCEQEVEVEILEFQKHSQ